MKALLQQTRVWRSWRLLIVGIGGLLLGACDNPSTLVVKENSTFEYESTHELDPLMESPLSVLTSDAGPDIDDELLRVGFSPARKPYMGLDERGRPVGFDIEFISMLLDHLERDYAFVPVSGDKGWHQLEAERLDLLIGVSDVAHPPEPVHMTPSYGTYKREPVTVRGRGHPDDEVSAPVGAFMRALSEDRTVSTSRFGAYQRGNMWGEPLSDEIDQRTCLEQLLAGTLDLCPLEGRFAARLAETRSLPLQSVGAPLERRPRAIAVGPSVRDTFVRQLDRALETMRDARTIETLRRQWFESRASGTL